MKKIIIIAAVLALAAAAFFGGRAEGIRHAIEDAEIWTVERYNTEAPEESAWNEYDQEILIELDGQIYSHGMTQC